MILKKIQKLNELSKELERKVLAPVIVKYSKDQAAEILTTLTEDNFIYHQSVFDMLKMAVETKNDLPTMLIEKNIPVSDFLKFDYITGGEWKKSIDELRRVSLALSYIQKTSNSIEKTGYKSIEEDIAAHISDLSGLSILKGAKVDSKKGIVDFQKSQEEIAARMEAGEKYVGIATGFDYIDNLSEGILPNSLTVIGGYSGAGKTSLAINFIANILDQGKRVVMFSLEMGSNEIYAKLIALVADLNPMKILKGFLSEEEFARVEEAKARVYEYKFEVFDNIRNLDKLKMAMIKESLIEKPDLFVIDYIQMIADPKYKTTVERMSVIPNELKDVSKSTGVPIIAISSISNADARTKNDEVGGYKGSGDIEFAADLAIKLLNVDDRETRDAKKKERRPIYIDLLITKQRHGATGAIQMSFHSYIGKFQEGRSNL